MSSSGCSKDKQALVKTNSSQSYPVGDKIISGKLIVLKQEAIDCMRKVFFLFVAFSLLPELAYDIRHFHFHLNKFYSFIGHNDLVFLVK